MSHILVASHAWYHDVIGGSFRLASEFAQHLAASGHRVSFVCCAPSAKAQFEDVELRESLHVYRYRPAVSRLNGIRRLWFHVRATERIVRRIHRDDPIQVVSGHSPLQMLGVIRALDSRTVLNYAVHSPFDDELSSNSGSGLRSFIAARLARLIDRRIVKRCHRMQTDSAYTLRCMISKHGTTAATKGIVAPGWVEVRQFQPVESRRDQRYSLGAAWQTDVPVFFTLRRLENRMGLETLIAASRKLADEGMEFRVLIGGGGSLRQSLQQQIDAAGLKDRVQLLGRLPEEQLSAAYAAADCFVLPTRALECFGLIVLEAFACNTPVIASNVAAIPELAERQGTDWMFEPGHVEQLADRMRSFIMGRLKPGIDLRSVAMEYDKPKVLKEWERILLEERVAGG